MKLFTCKQRHFRAEQMHSAVKNSNFL